MKLLLDTHAFVWAATGDPRLPEAAAGLIADPANSRTLSVASAWEMSIKARSGRWPDAAVMLDTIEEACADLDTSLLTIDLGAAIEAGRLEWSHRDPFDRMLVAQSMLGGYALLTVDRQFADSGARLAL